MSSGSDALSPTSYAILAGAGLALAEISRKVHFYSTVKPQLGFSQLTFTVSPSLSILFSQLLTLTVLLLAGFLLTRTTRRIALFHPAVLLGVALVISCSYLAELTTPAVSSGTFAAVSRECIKAGGYLITLAFAYELYRHEGRRVVSIAAVGYLLSGIVEIPFALISYQSLLTLCVPLPLFAVGCLLLYRRLIAGAAPAPVPGISATSNPKHPERAGDNLSLTSAGWIACCSMLAFGALRSLGHQNIEIAIQFQGGAALTQIFGAAGTILAGVLVLVCERKESGAINALIYGTGALIGFLVSAFIYLSSKSIAVVSMFTTFQDAAHRLALLLMWQLPTLNSSPARRPAHYAFLLFAFQLGILLGESLLGSATWQFVIMLCCFLFLLGIILKQTVAHLRSGHAAEPWRDSDADTPQNPAGAGSAADSSAASAPYRQTLLTVFLAEKYGLTQRETEILSLLLDDISLQDIAEELVISFATAKTHRRNIYKKLNISSQEELHATIDALKEEEFPAYLVSISRPQEGPRSS